MIPDADAMTSPHAALPFSAPAATGIDDDALAALLAKHAPARPPPLVPELRAFCADDELPLWTELEATLGTQIDAPFFAVPWPGAQVVARAIFDGVVDVRGRSVLELGAGAGLAAMAAARAGARRVIATDVDPLALQVLLLGAADNAVSVEVAVVDVVSSVPADIIAADDVIIAADVVYNRALGAALSAIIKAARDVADVGHVDLVVADSGRPFFDPGWLTPTLEMTVPVPHSVEGRAERSVRLFRSHPRR